MLNRHVQLITFKSTEIFSVLFSSDFESSLFFPHRSKIYYKFFVSI